MDFSEDQVNALNSLIKAARIGQKHGAYTLEEAAILYQSINVFLHPAEPEPETEPELDSEPEDELASEFEELRYKK